ncbi:MAG: hypothetical protein GVY22_10550 [Gammaproteobacteria bacterium]|jgi:hypothetical protein|nr:hypothetical protein [Gammaproteobacteria bacterium]
MSDDHFQLVFAGRLASGVSQAQARQRLKSQFKLTDSQLERLFTGSAVTVKRNLDQAAAERYHQAFLEAGAIAEIRPLRPPAPPEPQPPPPDTVAAQAEQARSPADQDDDTRLQLLPAGALVGEQASTETTPPPDTSNLSLAPSEGMNLTDCAPPAPDTPKLDLDGYELAPLDADSTELNEPGSPPPRTREG